MDDRFEEWKYPDIEEGKLTKYHWVVRHVDNFKLGYKTDIGAFTYINAKYTIIIEDYVQIGSHCSLYSVSTIDGKKGPIVLKKNCRVGSLTTIMTGVTIGENSIIGAHSYVTRSIPDDTIAFGVPARIKKQITPR